MIGVIKDYEDNTDDNITIGDILEWVIILLVMFGFIYMANNNSRD